jgi:hypothetical protein
MISHVAPGCGELYSGVVAGRARRLSRYVVTKRRASQVLVAAEVSPSREGSTRGRKVCQGRPRWHRGEDYCTRMGGRSSPESTTASGSGKAGQPVADHGCGQSESRSAAVSGPGRVEQAALRGRGRVKDSARGQWTGRSRGTEERFGPWRSNKSGQSRDRQQCYWKSMHERLQGIS